MKVWTVLPAYNEAGSLLPLLDSLLSRFQEAGVAIEVLVIDDGSTDSTPDIAGSYSSRNVRTLRNSTNQGLAETLKRGLLETTRQASQDDIIITMDADNTHPVEVTFQMLDSIEKGADVVIASRYREGSAVRGLSSFRRTMSFGASWLFRIFFPTPGVRDFTCGFRAYRASALRTVIAKHGPLFISEKGFTCMVDLLLRMRQENFTFSEVPMILRYDLKNNHSKMKVARTIAETLTLLFRRRLGAPL
ncbi:glycosyltransferase family 2 protein [bacterium]|jgi:dolichol-phosphate mannosyltransferase|nr:glycosyltransferase family 2 protein [bacterium]